MAENKTMRNDNIKKINEILAKDSLKQTASLFAETEKGVKELKKQLEEKLNEIKAKKAEQLAKETQPVEVVEVKPEVKENINIK